MDFNTWMRNPVCKVDFLGFEADTLRLQHAGWRIAAEQDPRRRTVRLALSHPQAHLYGLTNEVDFSSVMHTWGTPGIVMHGHLLEFRVQCMSSDVRVQIVPLHTSGRWSAVSAVPEFNERSYREVSIEDLVPFRTVNPDAEQIVVAPDSVPQILDLLLKIQSPAAQARRVKERRQAQRATDIHAQVVVDVA